MKEQYERALQALADKMEQLRDEQDETRFSVCSSMDRVAKSMARLGRVVIALEHFERMDNEAKETADSLLGNLMSIRKDAT